MHSIPYKNLMISQELLKCKTFQGLNFFFTDQIIFEAWNKEYERNPAKCIEYLRCKCYQNQKVKTMYNNFDFMTNTTVKAFAVLFG